MTASDARPPSDTGTTGWHIHANGQGGAWRDDHHHCENPRPVLVVNPAEARETIARALEGHEIYGGGHYCDCGPQADDGTREPLDCWPAEHLADAVLAALAGQGQP